MSQRVLRLRERRPYRVRLSRAEREFLIETQAGRLALEPTSRPGVWQLTSLGWVGAVDGPGLRIEVEPKWPGTNLLALLDLPALAEVSGGPTPDLPTLLAERLAILLEERLAAGLARGYVEEPTEGRYLRGRLDLPMLMRQPLPERLPCVADTFTSDLPVNRAVRAAVHAAAHYPGLPEALRQRLQHGLWDMNEIADVPLAAPPTETPPGYGPLLEVCRWLALGLGDDPGQGAGLWLSMDAVFERYVARILVATQATLPGVTVRVQPTYSVGGLDLRPDVVILRGDRPVLVIDSKWKRDRAARPADVYQVVAYATGLAAERALLIYPGGPTRHTERPFGPGPRLECWSLPVTGSVQRLRRGARQLGRALQFLSSLRPDIS